MGLWPLLRGVAVEGQMRPVRSGGSTLALRTPAFAWLARVVFPSLSVNSCGWGCGRLFAATQRWDGVRATAYRGSAWVSCRPGHFGGGSGPISPVIPMVGGVWWEGCHARPLEWFRRRSIDRLFTLSGRVTEAEGVEPLRNDVDRLLGGFLRETCDVCQSPQGTARRVGSAHVCFVCLPTTVTRPRLNW